MTAADPRDGLLPCPFCGERARLECAGDEDFTDWWVSCSVCGAVSGENLAESVPDREFATASWNTRTAHARPEAVDEKAALEVLIEALSEEHGGEHHEDGCDVCRAITTLTQERAP